MPSPACTISSLSVAIRRRTCRATIARRMHFDTRAIWSHSFAVGKNSPDPRGFGVGVAGFPEGHPATPNRLKEMDNLKPKVDAGADYICTQLFFDNRDFYDFRERCELAGIRVPIVAGIMPITSKQGMMRMAELALGARIPGGVAAGYRPVQGRRGRGQGGGALGNRTMPRSPAQQRPRHPLLHAQSLRCDPANLREPGHRGLGGPQVTPSMRS